MSDLVERLRDADTTRRIGESYADTHDRRQRDRNEAAAEIEKLRAALEEHACKCSVKGEGAGGNCTRGTGECSSWTARQALAQEKPNE